VLTLPEVPFLDAKPATRRQLRRLNMKYRIAIAFSLACAGLGFLALPARTASGPDILIESSAATAQQKFEQGRNVFRFDTFGDQAFWGNALKLHQAIEGSKFGGVGRGVSPATALAVGSKVDVDALPASVIAALKNNQVNLNDPGVTLALLKLNSVVGVKGFFRSSRLHPTFNRSPISSASIRPRSARSSKAGVPVDSTPNWLWMARPFVLMVRHQRYSFRPLLGSPASTCTPGPVGDRSLTGMLSLRISKCTAKATSTIRDWTTPISSLSPPRPVSAM
jgi:hypothetical protein